MAIVEVNQTLVQLESIKILDNLQKLGMDLMPNYAIQFLMQKRSRAVQRKQFYYYYFDALSYILKILPISISNVKVALDFAGHTKFFQLSIPFLACLAI